MSKPSLTNELTRLYELLEKGAITQEEYEEHKALLLNQARNTSTYNNGYGDPAQTKPTETKPQIIINQSASAAASSSATAVAKNGGCLKSILATIGFFVVVGVLLETCSSNKKTTENTPVSNNTQTVANTDNQNTSQEDIQALLQSAKLENTAVNNEINTLWKNMDVDVRNYLKSQQVIWNRDKKKQCQSNAYSSPEENQIAYLNCETELTRSRISELQAQQDQVYANVKEAKLQKLKQEADDSIKTLETTWDAIPESIRDQLSSNLKSWTKSADNECDSEKPADTEVQTEINWFNCRIKLIKAKTKELEGYKL